MKKLLILLSLACVLVILGTFMFTASKKGVKAELETELTNEPLTVTGQVPLWLTGSLIRNGPTYVSIDGKTNHWLDGLAMLHAFSFHDTQVNYTNKFLRTEAYNTVFKKKSLDYDGFAVDPCRSLFKRFFTLFVPNATSYLHNANVNVAKMADQYVALTETPLPVHFDPQTLETLGVLDYQDKLPHARCWESAHPHDDFSRKETLSYLVKYGNLSFYTLYKMKNTSSTREIIAEVPVKEPSYMHTFAVTQNYVIFTEFPLRVKPLDLITKNQAFIKNFHWQPELGTDVIVLNRLNGELVGKYKTKPFFAFHHVNAFEKDDDLYFDIVCYKDSRIIEETSNHFNTSHVEEAPCQTLERFKLSLKTGVITSDVLFDSCVEFPRINSLYDGLPYHFVYLIDPRDPTANTDKRAIYKIDTETKEVQEWSEEGCYPGEPVFVAAPNATQEDDGVCLIVVLDEKNHGSFLLILDGKTFKELARAVVPHVIPAGLHGQFF